MLKSSLAAVSLSKMLASCRINPCVFVCCNPISTTTVVAYKDPRYYEKYTYVSKRSHRWVEQKSLKEVHGYTAESVPLPRTGGRGPNGRIWVYRKGGGFVKYVKMVDWVRGGPSNGEPLLERIVDIQGDDVKSAKLALVASEKRKRWIIATNNMAIGDMVKSSTDVTIDNLKGWNEGDSLPLACIPQGTTIHCIQGLPENDGRFVCSGGSQGMVIRHIDDKVVVRLPSTQELMLSNKCTAVLGKPALLRETKVKMYKAGQKRWLGIRPKSGLWHKKDGRFGRKEKHRKPLKDYVSETFTAKPHKHRLFNDVPFT